MGRSPSLAFTSRFPVCDSRPSLLSDGKWNFWVKGFAWRIFPIRSILTPPIAHHELPLITLEIGMRRVTESLSIFGPELTFPSCFECLFHRHRQRNIGNLEVMMSGRPVVLLRGVPPGPGGGRHKDPSTRMRLAALVAPARDDGRFCDRLAADVIRNPHRNVTCWCGALAQDDVAHAQRWLVRDDASAGFRITGCG